MKELGSIYASTRLAADKLSVKPDIHMDDFIFRFLIDNQSFDSIESACRYYFIDGRESAGKLADVLKGLGTRFHGDLALLEFASGYGCVTRHLPAVLPRVAVTSCDIHGEAVRFIIERLGQAAIGSHADPAQFKPDKAYDVIFSLSFFSHMPRITWGPWLTAQFNCLNPGGALIFTTHGSLSRKFFDNPEIPKDGFWYIASSEQKDLPTADYGQTVVTRQFVEREVMTRTGRSVELYREGYWWGHQDLFVVLK